MRKVFLEDCRGKALSSQVHALPIKELMRTKLSFRTCGSRLASRLRLLSTWACGDRSLDSTARSPGRGNLGSSVRIAYTSCLCPSLPKEPVVFVEAWTDCFSPNSMYCGRLAGELVPDVCERDRHDERTLPWKWRNNGRRFGRQAATK